MRRSTVLKMGLAVAATFALAVAIVNSLSESPAHKLGAVAVALRVATSSKLSAVNYQISGNGLTHPRQGTMDVDRSMSASAQVTEIPAGSGYTIELDALSADGQITCAASTDVDVVPGRTTQANIFMQCSDAHNRSVTSSGGAFDNCPIVTSLTAAPLSVPLKGIIALQAEGVDPEGDSIRFTWMESAGLGAISKATEENKRASTSTFTCERVGTTTLTVTGSDGNCADKASVSVTCTDPAAGGTGNVPGGGAPAGTGGARGSSQTAATAGASDKAASSGLLAWITGAGSDPTVGGAAVVGAGTGTPGVADEGGGAGGAGAGSLRPGSQIGSCKACMYAPEGDPQCANTEDRCNNCNTPEVAGGCDTLGDSDDQKLCNDLYACFVQESNGCLRPGGDPLPCWCGSNPTTCVTADSNPGKANGRCLNLVIAGARLTPDTYKASEIRSRLTDPTYPLGRAINVLSCQGSFCATECGVKPANAL